MKKLLQNLKIKQKIVGGLGLVLILLAIVSIVSYSTISSADNGFVQYRGWARNANLLGRIQANLLEARLQVKNFIQSGSTESVARFNERTEKLNEFIDQAKEDVVEPKNREIINTVDKEIKEYEDYFIEVQNYMKERDEIVLNVLGKIGLTIVNEEFFPRVNKGDANAANAMRHMLFARIYAMKFLDDNSEAVATRVRFEFAELNKYLNRMNSSKIKDMVNKYKDGFEKVVKIIQDRNETITDKLDVIGPKIASQIEEIKLFYKGAQDVLGPELQAHNTTGSLVVIIVSIIALVFGLLAGLYIANQIVKPIEVVSARVNQLQSFCITNLGNGLTSMARGDLTAKVEKVTNHLNFTQKDETGDIARSVDKMITIAHSGLDAYESVRDKINLLVSETGKLIDDSKNGLLDHRGDLTKVEGVYKEIIGGINDTLDAVIKPVKEGSDVLEVMATGDLTVRVTGDYKGDHQLIKNSINKLGDNIGGLIKNVTDAVEATSSASAEISSSSEQMAAGAQEQSSQATEVAGAVEEMTATIIETTQNAGEAANSAKGAGEIAKQGGEVVKQTVEGMNKIAEVVMEAATTVKELGNSSDKIGEIIQVIDDIADQTNLLALNAAIEAARAGEQGRGFAVVADEVRKLAERTTTATKEIATMIKTIQRDTADAVSSIERGTVEVDSGKEKANKAGETLTAIITSSESVVDMVSQVATASEQQSATVENISRNIEAISSVSHQSAAGVQQIAAAAEDLNRLTANLDDLVNQFKVSNNGNGSSVKQLASANSNVYLT